MTAKEYLHKIKNTNRALVSKQNELAELRNQKYGLKSQVISEQVMSTAIYKSTVADYIFKEMQIVAEQREIHQEWWKCREYINSIDNQMYSDVLRYYYLRNFDWDEVAEKMHIVKRYAYILHGKALQEFRKITGFQ